MAKRHVLNQIQKLGCAVGGSVLLATTHSAPIDISQTPLVVSNTESVFPNILFVLDDSGSMSWDYMPDYVPIAGCRSSGAGLGAPATGNFALGCTNEAPYRVWQFNGMAYNPNVRYRPAATASGGEMASQTVFTSVANDAFGVQSTTNINLLTNFPDVEYCTDSTFTDCLRNGNYVLPGRVNSKNYTTRRATTATGSGKLAIGAPDAAITLDRDFGPHYYNVVASEFCTDASLRHCQQGAGGSFTVPAPVRWCNTDANSRLVDPARNTCQAVRSPSAPSYSFARYPTKYATAGTAVTQAKVVIALGVSGCTSGKNVGVQSLTVGGTNLLAAATAQTNDASTLATLVRNAIQARTAITGYTASVSGTSVTITAPTAAGNLTSTATLAATAASTCSFSPTTSAAFSGYVAPTTAFSGQFERVDIVPSRTTYPRADGRSDCAASTHCTYSEEMTNFANWWAYYRTRMQAMKTSVTRAFVEVGANRRLGFDTLNYAAATPQFLNLGTFTGTHKTNWFDRLTKANPSGGTPLITSLTRAGRFYAGRFNGSSIDGVAVTDPMQYSCQRNYTILSTDGIYGDFGSARDVNNAVLGDQDGNLTGAMRDRVPVSGTLADVAAYYRLTDLRTTAPWCSGALAVDVCGSAGSIQNMTTFTLGFGVAGRMQYLPDYENSAPDFIAVRDGLTPNATTGQCSWQTSGTCTWPAPPSTEANVDDLWHAAVNGGGTYFSASNPNALFTGIRNTLEAIDSVERSTAAATTSNPNITAGDNQIFVSSFETKSWTGELEGRRINTVTGDVLTGQDWSAGSLLNSNTTRRVLMFSGAATTKLKDFAWSTMSSAEKAHFEMANITATGRSLSQYCLVGVSCLSSATQTASAGEPLVRYLAGERTLEGEFVDVAKPWRLRESLLGDIVNSEAVYVGKPSLAFSDSGYGAFASSAATRRKMVYVASNSGMLHAFDATTGNEVWAFVPTAVLPRLYKLADKDYANKHEYFVDGSPTVQDAFIGGEWRTVLVGSLGLGGRSYFALDITDPDNPKALWEFTHPNMGLTVGRAEIGKLASGEWVVVLPSGLNNIPNGEAYYSSADGKGYIYVVNLSSGTLVTSVNGSGIIPTGQGSTSTPSGLGHIRAWYDDGETNATMLRLYGGDNLGNVWRFDVNNNVAPAGFEALRLITLKDGSGNTQPVTSRPELGQAGSYAMVYVGTGRYLGTSDFSDTSQQSIYAIKDRLTDQSFDQPRSAPSAFVRQTLVDGTCPTGVAACTAATAVRSVPSPLPVNLATNGGWYVDLPVSSERVTTEPVLALGTLVVTSNILVAGNVCEQGQGWVNFLDYRTGASVVTAQGVASVPLNGLGSRSTVGMLPNGAVRRYTTVSNSPRMPSSGALPVDVSAGGTRRHSWRDLGGN